MPYTVNLSEIDLGSFIGLGPALNGTFANLTPSPATDTATATPASPRTLTFTTATPPPPGVATLHVANTGPTGDLFRSGLVIGVPPSPAPLAALSFPTALTRLSGPAFATMLSARIGTIALTPPPWVVAAVAAASLGTYIPLSGAITGVVPTLNDPPAAGGAGSVTLTVTGFFTFRVYYFFTDTMSFTGTIVLTPAPSGDATQRSRVLSVTAGGAALATTTTGPSPTLATWGWILSLIAPAVGATLQPKIEAAINDLLDGLVAPGLASMGFLRSPTSVLSARNVTISSRGIALSLVLADLLGPAITPIPGNLHAAVSPAPQAGSQHAYTVTVTNTATGTPINQASVTLLNYTANGTAQTMGPFQTSASGQTLPFNVALQSKITYQVIPDSGERVRVFHPPTLTVSKAGFTTINVRLLEDTEDI
jgi:hypothetical protein